eukprot:3530422-Rhodomonas_salina.1
MAAERGVLGHVESRACFGRLRAVPCGLASTQPPQSRRTWVAGTLSEAWQHARRDVISRHQRSTR